jgi:hypothetical protein
MVPKQSSGKGSNDPPQSTAPPGGDPGGILPAWSSFIGGVQILLVPDPDDRPSDQFLALRDRVIPMAKGKQFLDELRSGFSKTFPDGEMTDVRDGLLLELESFSRAVEVAQATSSATVESKKGWGSWWKSLLGRGSIVTGSVKDIISNLPPYAKNVLTMLKETLDLFKGG